jgi:hypothetical protein
LDKIAKDYAASNITKNVAAGFGMNVWLLFLHPPCFNSSHLRTLSKFASLGTQSYTCVASHIKCILI